MKHCLVCNITKDIGEFNKHKNRPDGLQTRCRSCQKIQNNQGYEYNEKRRNSIKAVNALNRAYNSTLLKRYKRYCGCQVCGEREPCALDLHHLDPAGKDANPSSLITYSTKTLKREIRKCAVLCANCHRKVHAGILTYSSIG